MSQEHCIVLIHDRFNKYNMRPIRLQYKRHNCCIGYFLFTFKIFCMIHKPLSLFFSGEQDKIEGDDAEVLQSEEAKDHTH